MGAILIVVLLIIAVIWVYLDGVSQKKRDNKLFDELFEVKHDLKLTKDERYMKMLRLCMDVKGRGSYGAYIGIEVGHSIKDKEV